MGQLSRIRSAARRLLGPSVPPRRYAYLGNSRGLIETRAGHRMFIDTRDLSLAPGIILSGEWEPATESVLRQITPEGATVCDIGANFGCHTLTLARAVGPSGKVYAFEANPHLASMLKDTIAINGYQDRCEVFNAAVLDRTGQTELCVEGAFFGGGHLVADWSPIEMPRHAIKGTTLPDALPDVGTIDLLRLDIEGCEPLALRGAEPIIRNSPHIRIVAEWSAEMLHSRCNLAEFIDWLCALDMKFWQIERRGKLRPRLASELQELPHCDVVMARGEVRS